MQQRSTFLILHIRKLKPQEEKCPRAHGSCQSQDLNPDFLKTILFLILLGSFADNF